MKFDFFVYLGYNIYIDWKGRLFTLLLADNRFAVADAALEEACAAEGGNRQRHKNIQPYPIRIRRKNVKEYTLIHSRRHYQVRRN